MTPRPAPPGDRCKATVSAALARGSVVQCSLRATRDGFCGVHHPDAFARRRAKADAKTRERIAAFRERDAAYHERSRRADAYDDLVAALRQIAANTCAGPCDLHQSVDPVAIARAALKRAERGK